MQPVTRPLSRPQTFPQSPESLDAVLGRFQEWTSTRRTSGDHGLREVTYEEAVDANRRRWQRTQTHTQVRTENDRLKAEPGVIPVEAPATSPASDEKSRKTRSSKQRKKHATATKTRQPDKVEKLGAEKLSIEKPGTEKRGTGQVQKTQTSFRAMLAETIAPNSKPVALMHTQPHTRPHARQREAERQVTLSLRMAPSEQAMIRARASAAGISTSAYLRQCALEVDQLREQMRQTLALIGQSAALAASNNQTQVQVPMQAPQPGFLERLKQVFFGGTQARNLSLRA